MNLNLLNLIKNISFSNIISGTNRTLNVVKKTIPVYKEIRPYINHEKSIFKNKNIKDIKISEPLKDHKTSSYNDSLTFFN